MQKVLKKMSHKANTDIARQSNVNIHNVNSSRDYTLNPDKTLLKKLAATKRQQIQYQTTGGGIKATMDAVSFELFRYACSEYYHSHNSKLFNIKHDKSTDNKGNLVQHTYSVTINDTSSYTVNIYPTRCSLLINGKATRHFTETDLPEIHKIMMNTTIQGKPVNYNTLNQLLAQELQRLINEKSKSETSKPIPGKKAICPTPATDDIACIKCSRNCRKNAVLCQNGHWVHYHCDRLTQDKISEIESSSDNSVFVCSTCDKKRVLKIPALTSCSTSENTTPKSISESILSDETNIDCPICSEALSDEGIVCEQCFAMCHLQCMNYLASDICICKACAASENQIKCSKSDKHESDETYSKQGNDNYERLNSANATGSLNITPPTDQKIEIDLKNDNNPILSDLKARETELASRQKELRQLEQKLRKKEDELKLKDVKIKEYEKNSMKYEQKIEALEYRNRELESTIKTLREHAAINSNLTQNPHANFSQQNTFHPQSSAPINTANDNHGQYNQLIKGIHDRVSAYVLLKVEKQIENLIDNDSMLNSMDMNSNNQPGTYRFAQHTEPSNTTIPPTQHAYQEGQLPPLSTTCYTPQEHDDTCPSPLSTDVTPDSADIVSEQQPVHMYYSYFPTEQTPATMIPPSEYCNYTTLANPSEKESYNRQTNVTGQPLYYQRQMVDNGSNEKKPKRFLRHANLISLVR